MAHIHERYDFTTSGYIVNGQDILLIHHKKLNIWVQPGGHIELDEAPDEAFWREMEEETGLGKNDLELIEPVSKRPPSGKILRSLPLPYEFNVHQYGDTEHYHVDIGYYLRSKKRKVKLAKDEANDIRWVSKEEIETDQIQLLPHVKHRTLAAIEVISNSS